MRQPRLPKLPGSGGWLRSTSCKPDTSAAVEITVVPLIANNTITQDQTICAGTPLATLIGSRPTGGNGDRLCYYLGEQHYQRYRAVLPRLPAQMVSR